MKGSFFTGYDGKKYPFIVLQPFPFDGLLADIYPKGAGYVHTPAKAWPSMSGLNKWFTIPTTIFDVSYLAGFLTERANEQLESEVL